MTLRFKTIKRGSLIISKRYNIFTKLWYKLRKKELPYNHIDIFVSPASIIDAYNAKSTEILLEPKKEYTVKESALLFNLLEEQCETRDLIALGFRGNKQCKELSNLINTIRPHSFTVDLKDIDVTNTKNRSNYYVSRLAEERNWNICIY